VAILLVAAALVAYLCQRLRVPPVVGFLVVGVVIGPGGFALVRDMELIEAVAEIGVILLLFTIGIEFSLEKLARIRRVVLLGGSLQVGLTVAATAGLLVALGVGLRPALFTGCLVALSSTAVVLKLLSSRGETGSRLGEVSLGVLVFQDLAVVAMVLLVPTLAGAGGGGAASLLALLKAGLIVVAALVLARRVMPRLLRAVARTCSLEVFVLAVVALCLGTAWATSLAGVSLSLGAFLAGLVVSESPFSQQALGEILPLETLFSATFFVSIGLLLDVRALAASPWLVLAAVVAVVLLKTGATAAAVLALGAGPRLALGVGILLAQVGEFSFVLERTGAAQGLTPGGLGEAGSQAFVAAAVLLMAATPALAAPARRLAAAAARESVLQADETAEAAPADGAAVLLAGYGGVARRLARTLAREGRPFVVLTLSPEGAEAAETEGYRVLRGDYAKLNVLVRAGLRGARTLVIADDDRERTLRVVSVAREARPDLEILARVAHPAEAQPVLDVGADRVIADEAEATQALLEALTGGARQGMDRPAETSPTEETALRPKYELTSMERRSPRCRHTGQARAVTPGSPGCEECLALGETWVQLRVCMSCGHVGCCDSSKNRHGRLHWQASGHAIIKSVEPGEDWAWCFVDEAVL
jgi:CPA2 family monovalent cation:H+ antiporter-2